MRSDRVVVILPERQSLAAMIEGDEQRLVQQLIAHPAMKLSIKAFCCGLPGAM
jgi:hypothetical protein